MDSFLSAAVIEFVEMRVNEVDLCFVYLFFCSLF